MNEINYRNKKSYFDELFNITLCQCPIYIETIIWIENYSLDLKNNKICAVVKKL